jgi:L-alanine-DL-glutamate epimerase-like enolase superfamily enzyme
MPASSVLPGTADGPAIEDVAASVYVIPTDVPEANGALSWNGTAVVLATVRAAAHSMPVSAHCAPSVHAHVGAAVVNLRHIEYFHDHLRIERLLFDGVLDPQGGAFTPDPDQPGLGPRLKTTDAERYRRA